MGGIQNIAGAYKNHLDNNNGSLAGVPGGTVNSAKSTIRTQSGEPARIEDLADNSCSFSNDCNKHGTCKDENTCDCDDGFTGKKCEVEEKSPPTGLSDAVIAIIAVVCVVALIL